MYIIKGVIARVISRSDDREARGRFEITSTITLWIVLHSVLLPLLIIIIIIIIIVIIIIIIYMKKLLDFDWLRAVQFKCNTSAKSLTLVQKV